MVYIKKITITIQGNSLLFKYRTNKPSPTNLLNTNIISDNELVFSDAYIMQNLEIVSLFLKDLYKEQNIHTIVISNNDMVSLVLSIIDKIDRIACLYLKDDHSLPYSILEQIVSRTNICSINCYSIPTFMIEILDKHDIQVESRNEVLFTSHFMLDNSLSTFDQMYYQKSVRIKEYTEEEMEDFRTFIQINKYLKVLHIDKYSYKDLLQILAILKETRKKVVVQIHEDIEDIDEVMELKTLNKELKKIKIKLSLRYSDAYLEKNYIKQISFTTLKICALLIFVIISSIFCYLFYNNFQSEKEVNQILGEVRSIMESEETPNEIELNINEPEIPTEKKYINGYDKLLHVNSDTVGWLTVKETKVDYPVLKTTDNLYYLKRNFYKEKDNNGWVFMDYRNSIEELDTNTIIYAHNRYYSGVMFGTLNNVTKKKWYTNEDNLIISFHSLYQEMYWKVFSIYSINVTNDYLYTNFETKEDYQNFLDLISSRSDYSFATPVSTDDKILTLSTCLDNNKRLVVHAVLQS